MDEQASIEAVGEHYDAKMMMVAREKSWQAVHDIGAAIRPGMTEEQGVEIARQTLKAAGLLRGWHAIYVRFGTNTLKDYTEASEPGVVLKDNDIFYIDIGPVWQKWEGDAGDTFVVGNDPDMQRAPRDARTLFADTRNKWRKDGATGQVLYQYMVERARELGWELNLRWDGHRLSDFPHKAIHSGTLANAPFKPTADLWVLEIQIRHPTRPFSAFYEDMLLSEDAETDGKR